jgi:hypothetical protein
VATLTPAWAATSLILGAPRRGVRAAFSITGAEYWSPPLPVSGFSARLETGFRN